MSESTGADPTGERTAPQPVDVESILASDAAARDTVENALGQTLFVEAGAGTGKTTALVKRIVNTVLNRDAALRRPLSQIAAITFTEAAAAELRERIRVAFETELHKARDGGRSEWIERCEQALADTDVAAISTLHAFAQRLLSEFPVEIGVPPRVEVIDEVRSQIAFRERWRDFLDSLYDDADLEEFIVRASILGVSLDSAPMRHIAQEFDDNWDFLLDAEPITDPPSPIDFSPVHRAIAAIRDLRAECTDAEDKLLTAIVEADAAFVRFESATSDHQRLRLMKVLSGLSLKNGKQGNWHDVVAARETCAHLKFACEAVTAEVSSETLRRFASRIAEFTCAAAQQRRTEGVLEFHDLLVLAHMLLRESPEARAALSERYRVLMLDEFQDTDPIQISLASLLSSSVEGVYTGDWSDLTPDAGRLFMVGDPKQSIYRFRRADIALFLSARTVFGDGGVSLQRNFRTVGPIIEMVNAFFAKVMPEDTAGQAAYTPLVAVREPASPGPVDHRPLVLGGPCAGTAREAREIEAADVASVIVDIRDNPDRWLVESGGRWRPPELRDVTVLVPTRTSLSQLSHALDDQGIPFRADTGTLVYETQEIRDLLSALRAIDDPSDQVALSAALLSPLYGCGYDDLHRFVSGGGRLDLAASVPDPLVETVVARGIAHLAALADRRWWDEPGELLQTLVDERHAMALPASGRRARDAWRRIRYVIDQARAFSEAGGGDLRDYLDWTDLQGADGSKAHEPMLPELDDDAVQIMTIHGSKGLEFPITIVSGMTTSVSGRRAVGQVFWDMPGELPEVGVTKDVHTAHFEVSKELDDQMDAPERDRLLYVALTRARDHLVVSGHHRVRKSGAPVESHGAKVYEWAEGSEGLVRRLEGQTAMFGPGASVGDAAHAPPVLPSPELWAERHRQRLDRASRRSVVSATALATHAEQAGVGADPAALDSDGGGPADEIDDDVAHTDDAFGEGALPPLEFRRGRAGTAIGSAVHAVLQFVDFVDPTDSDIVALCRSQSWAESIPEHVEVVEASVRAALDTPIVQACRTARHWKELFVAAPVADLTIEGYVDLVVETESGLVIVDYKTDAVRSEAEVDAKLERYRLQGAAYAAAVEQATARRVEQVQFVFCRPEGAIVRTLDDVAGLVATVSAAAQRHGG